MEKRISAFMRRKKRFICIFSAAAFIFYFSLPLSLIFFPDAMNRPGAVFGMPWAWVYALLQFPAIWFLVSFYHFKVRQLERILEGINEEGER